MIARLVRRTKAVLRDSVRIWWLAPIIPLIAVLPEFAQHVAEVQLGFFESREAGVGLSYDETRWTFGYFKIAGLLIAMLCTIRFWGAQREDISWWSPKGIAWKSLGLALIANAVLTASMIGLEFALVDADETVATIITTIITIATLPLLVWIVAALIGERETTITSIYRTGWWAALRIAFFCLLVFVPLQYLHGLNHDWAFGASSRLLWGLMVFDSLVVGLLAVGGGTALHHGYRALSEDVS